MKYLVVIPDGCADRPIASLQNRTPMQAAKLPNLDRLAASGISGTACFVPDALPPGSDVATLALLGYDPLFCYTGRAPLEAAARGIDLGVQDWAIRCNLVTLEHGMMKSFTAGHVSTEEASALLASLQEPLRELVPDEIQFYPGVGYRNLLVYRCGDDRSLFSETECFAPHDFSDRPFEPALPKGPGSERLRRLMEASATVFAEHPVNALRVARGKPPVTHIWLWGHGRKLQMPTFAEKYRVAPGAMITAVDLHRGIAALFGWDVIEVPGATGYVDTDYAAKGHYAAEALETYDIVCVHVEAPDEAGHEGGVEKKIEALRRIDGELLPPILRSLCECGSWRILVAPDHPTPIETKTHARESVPWLIAGSDVAPDAIDVYDERAAAESARRYLKGHELMSAFLNATF